MIDQWLEGELFRVEQNDCILRSCQCSADDNFMTFDLREVPIRAVFGSIRCSMEPEKFDSHGTIRKKLLPIRIHGSSGHVPSFFDYKTVIRFISLNKILVEQHGHSIRFIK